MTGKRPDEKRRPKDDASLWEALTQTVTPLKRGATTHRPQPSPETGAKTGSEPGSKTGADSSPVSKRAKPAGQRPVQPTASPAPRPKILPDLKPGITDGLDARTMSRLRKGQVRPEARLDLHGMTRGEAAYAVAAFISGAREQGKRCVIVITGKGRTAEGGILRSAFAGWLNLPGNRPSVLGFCSAQPRDGGDGAFYVLLRRSKKGGS